MQRNSASYRADIDGLRAIAIAGVLVFHANPTLLSGGFVGVDVFFVISGFLITSIIHRDVQMDKFSLAGFYERRIRRIVPALFFVFLATMVAGYFLMLPDDFSSMSESMIHAVASISNIHFLDIKTDYYNNDAAPVPLLHTWSLGVEEQFYLIFPLIVLGLHKILKSTKSLAVAFSILFIISLGASAHYVDYKPMKAFFLLPFRAWGLLLGSMLAIVRLPAANNKVGNLLGVGGLSMILIGMLSFGKETPFPGWAALVPCLGSALLIYTGQSPKLWTSRLLSWKPFVGLGLISYSVYLWHWPLMTFVGQAFPKGQIHGIYLILGSLILGGISWRLVEQPFRKSGFMKRKQIFAWWASSSVALIATGSVIMVNDGFPQRFPEIVRTMLEYKNQEKEPGTKKRVGFDFDSIPLSGDHSKEPTIALWGDSFAHSLQPLITDLAMDYGECVRRYGRGGVAPVVGFVPRSKQADHDKILDYNQRILDDIISKSSLKTVILKARWDLYSTAKVVRQGWISDLQGADIKPAFNQAEFFAERLNYTVRKLLEAGKTVVIVYPIPAPNCVVPDHLARLSLADQPLPTTFECRDLQQQQVATKILDSLPISPQIIRVFPKEKLMVDDKTMIMFENKPLYYDAYHLSPPGAFYLRDLFEPIFRNL